MSVETSKHVLNQVLEGLRRTAVMPRDASTLAFQLLAWADQSAKEKLGPEDRIGSALQAGAGGIVEALERLAQADGTLGQAFNNSAVVARSASGQIVEAAAAAKRLADSGVLDRFSPADVAADLIPAEFGYEAISGQLVRILAELTFTEDAKSIYCPWEFSGQLIGTTLGSQARVHAETALPFPLPALISLFREGPTTVAVTDPLRNPSAVKSGRLEKFEATLALPPFGIRIESDVGARDIYGRFTVPKATATGLMIQHVVAQTDGLAAIVVPNSFLFGPGTDREVREHLIRAGHIQAVIGLPTGIWAGTGILTAVILLNTRHRCASIRFLDATNQYFSRALPKRRAELLNEQELVDFCTWTDQVLEQAPNHFEDLDASVAIEVSADEVLRNEARLQVEQYVIPPERRRFQTLLEAAPTVPLESLVDFVAPVPNKDRDGDFEGVRVVEVGAADLPAIGYIGTPTKSISVRLTGKQRSGDAKDVFLRPFDVLLIIKGSVGKIGIVPEHVPAPGEGGWVAGQSATVLRGREGEDLRALAVMLRSKNGQELLGSIRTGATIPMISLSSLRRLAIPTFPIALAVRAISVLEHEAELQAQIDNLKQKQAGLAESLWDELLEGHSK